MPESCKTTLLELSARFQAGGIESVLQVYPDQEHFLLILPLGDKSPPVVWTSSNPSIVSGRTTMTKIDIKESLKEYTFPNAVVNPIQKSGRNDLPYICVGRHVDADIRFNTTQVSKNHSAFYISKEKKLLVQDLCSTNGTFINDSASFENETYTVESWTEIRFGDVRALYTNLDDLLELLKSVKIV